MITFPNAKINLGLQVLAKRDDGYHEIETCLYPIDLCDVLEIVKSDQFSFQSSGFAIDGDSNLAVQAYDLLNTDFQIPSVSIHLHKVIPMGAGLGGGSSDAAFTLKMLNEIFELELDSFQLRNYAAKLGADCPFFIENTPAIATGTGTDLEHMDLDLSSFRIELRHPAAHISTAEAYAMITPSKSEHGLKEVLDLPKSEWQGALKNDFEEPILDRYPEILQAKNEFINEGAIYAAMTGSGASVFGMFLISSQTR
ncbi:MAG: 4-(cytidine 5'-diphospho)-2-C-methyl-D-erythritol kinase [Cytophagales bacterium]|nr:4-(cytidine 5'-diphospho)-2-C-methyl-D-erythritol kinase [Cytophagales bacterium]